MVYNGAEWRKKNLHRENRVTDEFLIKIKNLRHTKDLELRPRGHNRKTRAKKKTFGENGAVFYYVERNLIRAETIRETRKNPRNKINFGKNARY